MSRTKGSGSCPGCGVKGNFARHPGTLCPACRASLPPAPRDSFSPESVARDLAIHRFTYEPDPHLATLADRLAIACEMLNAVGIVGAAQLKLVRLAADKANAARHARFKQGKNLAEPWQGYSQWPF